MVEGLLLGRHQLLRSVYISIYAVKLFKQAGNFKRALETLKELIICNDKLLE